MSIMYISICIYYAAIHHYVLQMQLKTKRNSYPMKLETI